MITFLLLPTCVIGFIHAVYLDPNKDYGKLKWENAVDFSLKDQVPSGLQAANNRITLTYLARVKKNGVYYCGRFHPVWRQTVIVVDNVEIAEKQPNTEILSFPKGTASWVFMLGGDPLPDNVVECGRGPDGETMTYPCRGVLERQVAPGRYMPSTKKCVVGFKGAHELDRFEIMTTNMLAKLTNVI